VFEIRQEIALDRNGMAFRILVDAVSMISTYHESKCQATPFRISLLRLLAYCDVTILDPSCNSCALAQCVDPQVLDGSWSLRPWQKRRKPHDM
jgi:hypothetical protein